LNVEICHINADYWALHYLFPRIRDVMGMGCGVVWNIWNYWVWLISRAKESTASLLVVNFSLSIFSALIPCYQAWFSEFSYYFYMATRTYGLIILYYCRYIPKALISNLSTISFWIWIGGQKVKLSVYVNLLHESFVNACRTGLMWINIMPAIFWFL
jgi:hypothetical protein